MDKAIRRFFFSNTVFNVCMAAEATLIIVSLLCSRLAQIQNLFILFEIIVRTMLLINLFRANNKENLLLMSGLSSGLLFCILYRGANLVLGDLMTVSVHRFIMMGFKGSLYLCISMSILFLECVMTYNHFSINVWHINGMTKLKVNQLSTVMLFVMLIVQMLSNIFLDLNCWTIAYYICATMAEGVLFVLIGHCDLIMALDRGDNNE